MSEVHRGPVMAEPWSMNGVVNGTVQLRHAATLSKVDDFCTALGGKKPIHSILIANNGMAAVKFIRSIRTWAYETFGTEKAILLVAMATPEDLRINAEHIRIADQFVEVPGGTNNNNYANVQLIVEMAEITHVSAVWPGWGHASENPELPDALNAKGIIFLGPPAASMAALGDKIGSSLIAQAAGVPTLPWSGSHVKIQAESCLDSIPEEIYREACVYTTEEAVASCQVVGYPAMIKASWGGGGKGIRKVHNDDEVRALFKQVQGEVPGSPIFIMKLASQSRHLEVQLLCDEYGNVAALHSRDCSVQRRHQKIIEEGPITVAPLETVKQLEQAARRLAKCVGYVGAATVEYLYSMETGEYYFLELNPRLQVEHPVTEWIAEINLPAAQVAVGMGIPLWQIPEIRRFYGMNHGGGYDAWRKTSISATPFDFDKAESIRPKGHCVAVRVTSEDPDDGFKPTSGKVQELSFKSKPNVWAYFSVKSGGGIHEFSDSQFGHVFAFGESRPLAIANMVLGLKEIQIRGEIHTNVDYTIDLLHASEYRDNKIHTGWLDSRIAMRVRAERPPWYLSVVGGALYKASTSSAAIVSDYVGYLGKGQIPPKHISLVNSHVTLNIEGNKYTIEMVRGGPGSYKLRMNGSEVEAEIHTLRDGGLLMQLDGNSHVIYAEEEAAGTRLLIDGRTCLLQNDHDPSKLAAETPCKLLRFLVPDGAHVDTDEPYAEVEVMKMCMPLLLPASGVIHFVMSEGQAMQAGDLIAMLDLDDPSAVRRAEPFHGTFPKLGPPTAVSGKVHQRCAASLNAAQMILAGYEHNINEVVQDLLNCLDSPELPFLQWQETMSVLATRLPKDLRNELDAKYREYETISLFQKNTDFPARLLRGVLEAHLLSCTEKEKATHERLVEPLMSLVKSYEGGRESHARVIVQSLFEGYLSVEELFSDNIQADVIERLRLQHKKDLLKVVDIVLSHQGVRSKNKLILRLMEALVYPNPAAYRDQLIRFSGLNHTTYSELALKASQLLEQTKLSELRTSIARSLSELEMFTEEGERVSTPRRKSAINERMEDLVSAPLAVEDALVALFDHSDPTLQRRVVETYIRRLYQPYLVKESVRMQWHRSGLVALWEFSEEHIEKRNGSEDPIAGKPLVEKHCEKRWGTMVIIKSLQFLPTAISAALKETTHCLNSKADNEPFSNGLPEHASQGNMLHVALVGINNQMSTLQDSGDEDQAQERINKLAKILKENSLSSGLHEAGVRVISCIIQRDEGRAPMRHSFHWSAEKLYYEEEPLLRHLEPPLSTFLELDKLKGYKNMQYTPSRDRQWHLYTVLDPKAPIQRMFLRTLVRQPSMTNGFSSSEILDSEIICAQCHLSFASVSILRSLMGALEELELHVHNATIRSDHSHMYLCILREQQLFDLIPVSRTVDVNDGQEEFTICTILEEMFVKIHELVGVRMHRLAVCEWEVKLWLDSIGLASGAWRIIVTNVTGHTCTIQIYREFEDSKSHELVYHSATSVSGPLHGVPLTARYQPLSIIDRKRLAARKNNTTYCYDFPLAFETALRLSWASYDSGNAKARDSKDLLKVTELMFADKNGAWGTPLVPVERSPGLNDVGMIAWFMEMSTPEFPSGRKIIVVANDVTFKAGSFGPREDAFFYAVTNLSCEKKLPLIYLAANSGARIGVAEEVKACFRVGWSDELSPERGFHYIYLTPEDYARIGSSVVAHEVKLENGESRWIIDTIVGKEDGLGVENLTGSGAIAGAYSRAYKETFTLTYVTGRTVGIGAYLARLGMRCIQRLDQPIILTGFSALNKLLGREVYSSHMQLGGPKIMATNGVVHLTVSDDLEGISAILKWLSYIPPYIGGPLPISRSLDPPERPVEYFPENSCDPRAAICGIQDGSGGWLGGIFDRDSFIETLEGWAKTVVTGRARLGGIPVGIVAVETQTMMQIIPADPGQLDSQERIVPQAGQVWFPDSATKTSQALLDFNREELPLFILANWRGFSGGQRDLFEGILQAGSTIVENLRTYKQPVFVYIPMTGELRGGAWVVVDSKINPDHIEMYAEQTAKGNVLEPEGMIEIKFRSKELLECMGRLDRELVSLKAKLQEAKAVGIPSDVESIQKRITSREKQLLPVYTQIATRFAELHDTSLRMAAKGVINKVVDWESSRSFFYKRLHRRVSEGSVIRIVRDAAGEQLPQKSALELIKKWFLASEPAELAGSKWEDDDAFFAWKDDPKNFEKYLKELQVQKVFLQLSSLGESASDLQALPQGLAALLSKMDSSSRAQLTEELKQVLGQY
ncbi:acetyl-CoA carboxylase 1 [Elaeis guineensis]|uniref:Acetyl-CoA carboxylase 1 n=1 Tax=Elaeis guineensis var. tenera TaxID=51953 RepID=A0A6J0PGA0_ELAGV|nr:acetyl-CoA carboxylase 1 [Elaeis guineensis]XP_019704875.1 acetyl-CoA carboxylase 1 [Elaeis guineensis]XP_029119357.1 acetyl-CoA carboxylase 1 [Elaeis guineensis]